MNAKKAVRRSLWGAAALATLAAGVYLLRWPLFGGLIRREIARLAGEHLKAEVQIARLGGSLLWGIQAEGLELRPRPGSPLRSGAVRGASVSYGFLGRSPLGIEARGALIVLAPRSGSPPGLHETVGEALTVLRSLHVDGRVRLQEASLVFPDGRRLELADGELEGGEARASLRTQGLGEVSMAFTRSESGTLRLRAKATEGPVRSLEVELGRLEPSRESLRIEGTWKEQAVHWSGELLSDREGRPERAVGGLRIPQGRADTAVDLVTGRVKLDVDGTIPLREPVRADVELQGLAEGPLEGPLKDWSFTRVVARTKSASYRSLRIDRAEAFCPRGTLSNLEVSASLTAGPDRAEVAGVVRGIEEGLELELSGHAEAADLAPYLGLLPAPPPLAATRVRAEGTLRMARTSITFDGSVESAAGSYGGRAWESARLSGSYSSERIVARDITVRGTVLGPLVTGKGRFEGSQIEVELEGGPDRAAAKGRLEKSGDFSVDFTVEGPCRWLTALKAELPGWALPVRAKGRVERGGGVLRGGLSEFSAGSAVVAKPEIVAREKDGTWRIEVAPGTIGLPGPRVLEYGAFVVDLGAAGTSVDGPKLVLRDPRVTARLSARVERKGPDTRIDLDLGDLEVGGTRLSPLVLRADLTGGAGRATVEARWGREGQLGVEASGQLGSQSDVQVHLRVPDFGDPVLRKVLGEHGIQGGAAADLRLTGPLDRPDVSGSLSLKEVGPAGWRGVSLVLEIRTEGGRLRARSKEATPYGTLALEAELALPGTESRPRLDLSATLEADDFSPFLERVDPGVRKWIPPGKAVLQGHLQGTLDSPAGWVEGTFESARFRPPEPLGEARDVKVSARLDRTGLELKSAEGTLGGGRFQARGLWDLWKEDRPLRISVAGDELLVVDDPQARIRIKPEAALHWTRSRGLWLDGFVEVPLVLYHREFGSPALGSKDNRSAKAPIEASAPRLRLIPLSGGGFRIPGIEGLEALRLDLEFRTTGECRIENSLVGALLGAEGRLRGTGSVPALSGWVRTTPRMGEIRLGPRAFIRIESSELTLPAESGREASVRFEGRLGSGQNQLTILIAGPPDHPTLTLVSDPPKDQRELLAILGQKVAFGTLTAELPGISDEWPVADRKEGFFSKLAPTVVPGETPGQKRQPWELPAVGTSKGTVVRTEYIYNRYFSIVAESDRQADVSGDVKLRIRF